eukprot:11207662-Lingulodinium_polyedra.AAC.1
MRSLRRRRITPQGAANTCLHVPPMTYNNDVVSSDRRRCCCVRVGALVHFPQAAWAKSGCGIGRRNKRPRAV